MTKFNPENKEVLTYGECLDPAMKITDQTDANQYLDDYVKFIGKNIDPNYNMTSIQIAKSNLGYYAGYYDNKTRERVEKLFICKHPIFGSIAENGTPTPEEAFNLGIKIALKSERKKKIKKINNSI